MSVSKIVYIIIFVILLFLVGGMHIFAQSPDKILKKAAKASGFEKEMRNVQSWQMRGRVIRLSDGASGEFNADARQPNLYRIRMAFGNYEISQSFNGKSAWMRDSREGLRTLTGGASESFQAEASFRASRWLRYKEEKSIVSGGGRVSINGKTLDSVVLTTTKNVKIKLFFDPATSLLVREEIPSGDKTRVFDYADFRSINGVQEPFTIKFSEGTERFEVKVEQVIHNTAQGNAIFDFPRNPNEKLPDIRTFLEEVKANQAKVDKALESYSYDEEITDREFDKNGNLLVKKVETFEVTTFKGKLVSRLVARNGVRLSEKDQARQDSGVQKEVEKIERNNDIKDQEPTIGEILRASSLVNPRRERFKNRDVIVFDFEPDPNFVPGNNPDDLQLYSKLLGTVWIDEKDKQVARVEAKLTENFKVGGGAVVKIKKGGYIISEQERFDDQVWLPSLSDVNISIRIFLVKGLNLNQVSKYSNYKKFATEVKESEVKESEVGKPKQ